MRFLGAVAAAASYGLFPRRFATATATATATAGLLLCPNTSQGVLCSSPSTRILTRAQLPRCVLDPCYVGRGGGSPYGPDTHRVIEPSYGRVVTPETSRVLTPYGLGGQRILNPMRAKLLARSSIGSYSLTSVAAFRLYSRFYFAMDSMSYTAGPPPVREYNVTKELVIDEHIVLLQSGNQLQCMATCFHIAELWERSNKKSLLQVLKELKARYDAKRVLSKNFYTYGDDEIKQSIDLNEMSVFILVVDGCWTKRKEENGGAYFLQFYDLTESSLDVFYEEWLAIGTGAVHATRWLKRHLMTKPAPTNDREAQQLVNGAIKKAIEQDDASGGYLRYFHMGDMQMHQEWLESGVNEDEWSMIPELTRF